MFSKDIDLDDVTSNKGKNKEWQKDQKIYISTGPPYDIPTFNWPYHNSTRNDWPATKIILYYTRI